MFYNLFQYSLFVVLACCFFKGVLIFLEMGKAQLFYQPLLGKIYMAPVFSNATVESFGTKSLRLTGDPLNLNFHFSQHSSWPCLDFLVFEGIWNCFIMHYFLWTPPLDNVHFTETNCEPFTQITWKAARLLSAGVGGHREPALIHRPAGHWVPQKPCCDSVLFASGVICCVSLVLMTANC